MFALRPLLILVLVLTSTALGAARGQARIAGEVVICSGSAYVVVTIDADGNPVEHTHFCPDMAQGLLAAIAPAAIMPARPMGWVSFVSGPATWCAGAFGQVPAQARGPPCALGATI